MPNIAQELRQGIDERLSAEWECDATYCIIRLLNNFGVYNETYRCVANKVLQEYIHNGWNVIADEDWYVTFYPIRYGRNKLLRKRKNTLLLY